jgi:hypothetical protein
MKGEKKMKQLGKDKARQPTDTSSRSCSKSLAHFCQFVNKRIRLAQDPGNTAALCENRAEAVRITKNDINQDTIDLLLGTLLDVIAHLEKKWLDERKHRVNVEQNVTNDCLKNLVDLLLTQMAFGVNKWGQLPAVYQ